jgi:CMP-N-acetylneuraminic acid synthetase
VTYRKKTVLAVVPARGGSKGIPRKNLAKIGRYSLIARVAITAEQTQQIDRAIISTDDAEMAEEGVKFGLESPFTRPKALSDDMAQSIDVWKHAWLESEAYYGIKYDVSLLLEPTSPHRMTVDIVKVLSLLIDGGHAAVATVSQTPIHFTPEKTLQINSRGSLVHYLQDGDNFSRRQDVPIYYHQNGICYAATRDRIINGEKIFGEGCVAQIIERKVVNIDTIDDLAVCQKLEQP